MLSLRQLKRDKTNTSESYDETPHNGTKGGQTSRSPSVGYENLFFFTDQEYFHTSRFEYLTQKEPQKGFVFGLIVRDVENAHFDVIGDGFNSTILSSYHKSKDQNKDLDLIDHAQDLKNFRVLKNLGSRIYNVSPFYDSHNEKAGYDIEYKGGDNCLADERVEYKSHVRYQCDVNGHENINDFP